MNALLKRYRKTAKKHGAGRRKSASKSKRPSIKSNRYRKKTKRKSTLKRKKSKKSKGRRY